MNKTNLKRYAPAARKDFIAAVTARAHLLGLRERSGKPFAEPCEVKGDVALIGGRPWPAKVQGRREALLQRMQREGFAQTLEAVAYTWFNRLAALRYMELHDYLGHGRRVLSNPEGGLPEVLTHALALAESGELPGLLAAKVRDLKLANRDGELYRDVLIAQCNALHQAMPFLFEALDDETELLLPDNLLLSDAIVAKLVSEIPEHDWAEVEVVGWLYQFYISEKKEQVIGKVVKSEDIPAATQLFTPNWTVQYLVQNSIGRLWLMANPGSTLASQWPYYIQPAEQTPEVQAQLDALIQTRIREDGEALNPETVTVLDPACGSGHMLVVAYDVLKAIYLERGYQPRAIPRLILEKNLYGLDIDDRAAQLASFALLMKARADDRRLFNDPPKLNVLGLQESKGLNLDELARSLAPFGLERAPLKGLLDTFEHAKTFGSLIQVSAELKGQLADMRAGLQLASQDGDLYAQQAAKDVLPLVWQAMVLGMQFDAVVANPPYMGGNGMNALLKGFAERYFPRAKSDLFAVSTERFLGLSAAAGFVGLMTPFTWMFLKGYEALRSFVTEQHALHSLIQPEYHSFFDSAYVPVCTFVIGNHPAPGYEGVYIKLTEFYGADLQPTKTLEAINNPDCGWLYYAKSDSFLKIPGKPIAYSASQRLVDAFESMDSIEAHGNLFKGLSTGNNDAYIRLWFEVSSERTAYSAMSRSHAELSKRRWFPCNKGGPYRKWSGNADSVIDWERDGDRLFSARPKSVIRGPKNYFTPCVSWSKITSGAFSSRLFPAGFIPLDSSNSIVSEEVDEILLLTNSKAFGYAISKVSETLDYNLGQVNGMPFPPGVGSSADVQELVRISKKDWNAYERSWDFQSLPLLTVSCKSMPNLESSYTAWIDQNHDDIAETKRLEEKSNRLFIDAYGLTDELTPDVPIEQITITVNPAYRYGGKLMESEQWTRFRTESCEELVSYAIGCMMGRYSLDEPGLIYAHAGNVGFDPSRYEKKFPADADGIVPITDDRWFEGDAASRVREFLRAVWGAETLEENIAWLAESLGTKGSETPDETIRRYLADKFFKDHLQTYKRRPIYWLFSSGKQGAFQVLVYLHRYHEGTLARLRAEYVLPLTGKMQGRIESLQSDIAAAGSTATRTRFTKQLQALKKQHLELLAYDEKLRHYADMRIKLDLDDGVKVNYGKFGDLLAEVKAITGGTSDD